MSKEQIERRERITTIIGCIIGLLFIIIFFLLCLNKYTKPKETVQQSRVHEFQPNKELTILEKEYQHELQEQKKQEGYKLKQYDEVEEPKDFIANKK